VQPDSAKCPKCGNSALVRPRDWPEVRAEGRGQRSEVRKSDVSSANHFNVRVIDGQICFSIFQGVEGKEHELRCQFHPELALNLTAWLAVMLQARGFEFSTDLRRLFNEIAENNPPLKKSSSGLL
jgi:hypothetical protein